jgi:hypothetical protein
MARLLLAVSRRLPHHGSPAERRDSLQRHVEVAAEDIERYRHKFTWVNGSYTAAYAKFSRTLVAMNASIASEQR